MNTSVSRIVQIYTQLCNEYIPMSEPIVDGLWDGDMIIETEKVSFPPSEPRSLRLEDAESGFLCRDCAILTAFRGSNSYEENVSKNEMLRTDLSVRGITCIPVCGCFREAAEKEELREDSFFVYDNGKHETEQFFVDIFQLSEKYGQDSFLYKSAGMTRTAFLISTNGDSRSSDGDITLAGQLYLNVPEEGPYTKLEGGVFKFSKTPV